MKKESFCIVDIESKSKTPIDRGPANYFDDPDAALICLSYQIIHRTKAGFTQTKLKTVWLDGQDLPAALPAELKNFAGQFVAHNYFFEWSAFKRFAPKTFLADLSRWLCTQAMSRRFGLAAPRSSLEHVAALLKIPAQKNPDGKRLIQTYSIPDKKTGEFNPIPADDKAAWLKYCADDVEAEAAIFQRLWPRYSDDEKAVFEADKIQQARGVPIDLAGVDLMIAAEEKYKADAEREAEHIAGRNEAGTLILSGTDEFITWMKKTYGVDLPNAQAGTLAELAAQAKLRPLPPKNMLRALEIRQALMSRAAGKASKLKERTSADGRYYNPSTYGAAHTGRWQSWGANFFNFYKYPVKSEDWENVAARESKAPTKRGLASLQRGLICATKGRSLITTDWRGIEKYLAVFYCGDKEKLHYLETGQSLYLRFGQKLYGREITKKDEQQYNVSKIAELSLQYAAGWQKFIGMVKQQAGIDLDEATSKRTVNTWQRDNPAIVNAWRTIDRAFKAALVGVSGEWAGFRFTKAGASTVIVTLPNGYEAFYPGLYYKGRDLFWRVDGEEKKIYGGYLLENFMQALGAQLLRRSLVELERRGVEVVLHVYDEIVAECETKKAAKTGKLIADVMRSAPEWAPALKLEVEQKITKRWGK